jgi:hypothetical protein
VLILAERATPSTPAVGYSVIYPKADGLWYFKDDAGVEKPLAGTGINETIVDAKGDLIVATAADTVARKAVGANGLFLKADSVQADGLVWGTEANASTTVRGLVELATQVEADAGTADRVLTTALNKIALATPVTLTTQTAVDFTVPSGTRRVSINFAEVSLSGTDTILVQIGPVAGVETSAYISSSGAVVDAGSSDVATSTAGFIIATAVASQLFSGRMTLELLNISTNLWTETHAGSRAPTVTLGGGGRKAIAGELVNIRVTRSGTNTFDAGSVNITAER